MNKVGKLAVVLMISAVFALSMISPVIAGDNYGHYEKEEHSGGHYDKDDDDDDDRDDDDEDDDKKHHKRYAYGDKEYEKDCEKKEQEKLSQSVNSVFIVKNEVHVSQVQKYPVMPEQVEKKPEQPKEKKPAPPKVIVYAAPKELPKTGPEAAIGGLVGASALAGSAHAYIRSRRLVR